MAAACGSLRHCLWARSTGNGHLHSILGRSGLQIIGARISFCFNWLLFCSSFCVSLIYAYLPSSITYCAYPCNQFNNLSYWLYNKNAFHNFIYVTRNYSLCLCPYFSYFVVNRFKTFTSNLLFIAKYVFQALH